MVSSPLKLNKKNESRLKEIAEIEGKSIDFVLNETIENYLEDLHNWRVAKIKKSIEQCENGETVDSSEIEALFNKYKSYK